MNYYAMQILTNKEDDFVRRASAFFDKDRLIAPKRVLNVRRSGKTRTESKPVFSGYVFVESESLLDELDLYWNLRHTPGFIRFLRSNAAPTPLTAPDRRLLRHFMSFGGKADTSKVIFDENDRIVVLEGPLKGLEGKIVKVDRRKGRAKVALDICETGFLIDLGFKVVERVKDGGGKRGEDIGSRDS